MTKTQIDKLMSSLSNFLSSANKYSLAYFANNLIALLLGFFLSNALATLPSQTGEWGIIVSGLLVATTEIISSFVYQFDIRKIHSEKTIFLSLSILNNVKIGIIYGFFVDAFKLGS